MTESTALRHLPNSLTILVISSLDTLKATRERTSQSHNMCVEAHRRAQFSTKQSFIPPPKHEIFLHFHPNLLCRLTKKMYLCVVFRVKIRNKRYENHKPQSKKQSKNMQDHKLTINQIGGVILKLQN